MLSLPLLALFATMAAATPVVQTSGAVDPAIARAVVRMDEGDFPAAIEILQPLVRQWETDPHRASDLVQAYLSLGVCHALLQQEDTGRAYFREALKKDSKLVLDPSRQPPKVVRLFEAVRRALETEASSAPLVSPPVAAPPLPTAATAPSRLPHEEVSTEGGFAFRLPGAPRVSAIRDSKDKFGPARTQLFEFVGGLSARDLGTTGRQTGRLVSGDPGGPKFVVLNFWESYAETDEARILAHYRDMFAKAWKRKLLDERADTLAGRPARELRLALGDSIETIRILRLPERHQTLIALITMAGVGDAGLVWEYFDGFRLLPRP